MKNEHFEILRKLNKDSSLSQRDLAKKLGLSLGKVNYCLIALKEKGLIKINNFKNKKNKSSYLYILTPRWIAEKTKITLRFMKQKIHEYDELQKELEKK